jgi:hypothetical protein
MNILNNQGAQPFAMVKGAAKARLFTRSDFQAPPGATARVHTPTAFFEIARLSSPLEAQNSLLPDRACDLYLFAQATVTMSGALAAGTFQIDLTALGFKVAKSRRTAPVLPNLTHPDVKAFGYVGAAKSQLQIVSINYDTGIVEVNRTGGVTKIELWFLNGDGEFSFRAYRPTGGDTAAPLLAKYPFRSIHEADQKNIEETFKFDFGADLPPRWRVSLEVYSKAPMPWNDDSPNILSLPGLVTPVMALDSSRYNAVAELAMRGGRL